MYLKFLIAYQKTEKKKKKKKKEKMEKIHIGDKFWFMYEIHCTLCVLMFNRIFWGQQLL